MSDQRISTRRGGRPSKGPRVSTMIRMPEPLRDAIERARAETTFTNTNDFLCAVLQKAHEAGLFAAADETGQDRLPISA